MNATLVPFSASVACTAAVSLPSAPPAARRAASTAAAQQCSVTNTSVQLRAASVRKREAGPQRSRCGWRQPRSLKPASSGLPRSAARDGATLRARRIPCQVHIHAQDSLRAATWGALAPQLQSKSPRSAVRTPWFRLSGASRGRGCNLQSPCRAAALARGRVAAMRSWLARFAALYADMRASASLNKKRRDAPRACCSAADRSPPPGGATTAPPPPLAQQGGGLGPQKATTRYRFGERV